MELEVGLKFKNEIPADAKREFICCADFKTGETVIYDGNTCVVKNKDGYKCLSTPTPTGWSYFIPNWADVKRP